MYKFREPTFVEYLLYDVERFAEKGRREKFITAMHFLDDEATVDVLSLTETDHIITDFYNFVTGKGKVISIGR